LPDSLIKLHRLGYRLAHRLLMLWWFLRRPTTRGALVAIHDGTRLLVLRTSYRPGWTLPGGAVGRGETFSAAALRELVEETGIRARPAELEEVALVEGREDWRLTRTRVFAWRPEHLPQPRPDGAEIVWAAYRDPRELAGEPMTPGLRWVVAALAEGRLGGSGGLGQNRGEPAAQVAQVELDGDPVAPLRRP
jgi:8-oxo-dGTP pyrophosphatase MutT (NUDIX family)